MTAGAVHAVVFVATLEMLAIVSVVVAKMITASAAAASSSSTHSNTSQDRDITDAYNIDEDDVEIIDEDSRLELLLGIIAAILCWSLALFFYIKKMLKRRRRSHQRQEEERMGLAANGESNHSVSSTYGTSTLTAVESTGETGSTFSTDHSPLQQHSHAKSPSRSSVATVMSLTTLGALDELSYFPALLIGKIFTPVEICLGTLLAALTILMVVSCCLAKCQPLVDWLDRIPIYAVIAVFATILTLEVLYDVLLS